MSEQLFCDTAHSQLQSQLLHLPYDVRFIIYKHILPDKLHLHSKDGRIQISECIQPLVTRLVTNAEDTEQEAEKTTRNTVHDMLSTWGPHSPCEKLMLSRRLGRRDVHWSISALELTCRTTYDEINLLFSQITSFVITDLSTLSDLLSSSPNTKRLTVLFRHVQTLELYLEPPTMLLRLMSQQCSSYSKCWLPTMCDTDLKMLRVWLGLGSTLAGLESLKRLNVWVDGDAGATWWNVDDVKKGIGRVLPGREDVNVVVRRVGVDEVC